MRGSKIGSTRTILMYAQDGRGLGHINRTLSIARHVLDAHPDSVAYIVTKSPIARLFTLPPRCDYIKLPKALNPEGVEPKSREMREAEERPCRALRSQLLCAAAVGLKPDLVIVDHEPLGSKGEFRDGLYALKAASPTTRFVCGLRDIMDEAAGICELWRQLGVYEALEDLYDGIAVYGSPALFDVASAYTIPPSVRDKLHYCGFITREPPTVDPLAVRRELGLPPAGRLVLASVGGGDDGYPVLEAALRAIERLQARIPDLAAILVTGPFMPVEQQAALQARSSPKCRVLVQADNFKLMAAADAIVSMGGYNSVWEALAVARPLVIVPRATHKVEQLIRAQTLAAHDLARWVHPERMNCPDLVEAIEWALGCNRQAYARQVRDIIPAFDGAVQLTAYLSRWLGD